MNRHSFNLEVKGFRFHYKRPGLLTRLQVSLQGFRFHYKVSGFITRLQVSLQGFRFHSKGSGSLQGFRVHYKGSSFEFETHSLQKHKKRVPSYCYCYYTV